MPKLTITVTQEDINNGEPGACESCPIALAIQRTVPGAEYVEVDGNAYWETKDGPRMSAKLPANAVDFIDTFDARRTVFPIEFECDPEVMVYPCELDEDDLDDEAN